MKYQIWHGYAHKPNKTIPQGGLVEISGQLNMQIVHVSIYGQVSHTFVLITHSNYLHFFMLSSFPVAS